MSQKIRAAVLRIADERARFLLTCELLWRPLGVILAEALAEAGLTKLLIASDVEPPEAMLHTVADTTVIPLGDQEGHDRFLKDVQAVSYFNTPALIDASTIGELFSNAALMGPTILTSGGRHVAYGITGGDVASPGEMLRRSVYGASDGFRVLEASSDTCMTIETPLDLNTAESIYHRRINARLMESGVRLIGADTCFIAADAKIEPGVRILPGTIIRTECSVGSGTTVGPYAHIHRNCQIGRNCYIGSFVMLRAAVVPDGTELHHKPDIDGTTINEL